MTEPTGHLISHVLAFVQLLRHTGVQVSTGQVLDLVRALEHTPIVSREDFRGAARCTLISRHEDLPLFDAAFELFWRTQAGVDPSMLGVPVLRTPVKPPRLPRRRRDEGAGEGHEREREEQEEQVGLALQFSAAEHLRTKDFGAFSYEEVQACKALLRTLEWRIQPRRTRRKRPAPRGRLLDMRRMLRHNLRYGGEPVELTYREPRMRQRPLVVLCDISGSMERYSRILLQFVHTISSGLRDVEAFVFGTRLTRITRLLREKDIDDAIAAVSRHVVDWSGGTRIGEAIKEFNYIWGRRVLGRGPVVLVISDGWDRGDPQLLAREMERLQRSCHRLIWLNPLLGSPGYQPLTQGMQAALPFVDDFLPVHNLLSLEQLGARLSALGERRPPRRQRLANVQTVERSNV
ncbi:MAG TPA: VWA domain-containing protein [Roseiflexaceae bacterium]|nr:VWA domain-containing protein [Roseiflexaceae bacterium]